MTVFTIDLETVIGLSLSLLFVFGFAFLLLWIRITIWWQEWKQRRNKDDRRTEA